MTSGLTVEKTFDAEVLSAVKKVVEEQGISQKDLAKNIGYSTAAINTYLNEKYQGKRLFCILHLLNTAGRNRKTRFHNHICLLIPQNLNFQ